ncbi:IQ-domain 28, putative isoform 2 [Hibiscus syriacus]|uniref:IQ-domain 28, putative isoform 2 n=1 Tax=Hibiscus syriacus TaxID=106335 RepID=A0A6A3CMU5_HIBSY|nr:protein IQ-DOMAIN 31-like [Hibiscus syriacus]XP_039028318.1 protein IQ-DOMAIN 31-like [Hibiscus syriacus]XP_039028324.1 protein IQ-DOMAIN 31-like [Hibiscus syriacus]KAE8730730.1 IQ-domain 28, putative isoform 2 [Hibiscus syriacus]
MGKSPGKWIKTVFFGKRTSKTGYHKRRGNAANVKEVLVAVRASETDVAVAPPFSSQLNPYANERDERKLEVKNNEAANISNDDGISLPVSQGIDSPSSTLQDSQYDPERVKEEQAATIVKAAFRGYLARRAFGALKAIIRLQALIRGHLVRRQAITTLFCMMGIVKLQAHVRGVMARHSDGGLEVQKKLNQMNLQESNPVASLGVNKSARIGKLSENAFVRKLVASSLPILPLLLHVDAGEPNSVRNWLERWSASCFWKPVPQPRKASGSKLQRKQANGHVDIDTGRPKLSVRRIRPANLDGTSVLATSEFDKPKRNLRKVSSNPAESSVQENPQNEFEKVKRNLRKVHNSVVENSVQSEAEFEKPKPSSEKVSSTTNIDIVEQSLNSLTEKIDKEMALTVNSSAEKMKNEMSVTVTSSTEEVRETTTRNSAAEKMNKETDLKINNSAEKMKKETAVMVNSSAEKMREETATTNGSAEKKKKETPLTINKAPENMKKEIAMTVNSSTEKMRQETDTVNSTVEKMKERALTVNSSAEKMKKEIAVKVNGLAEKMKEMALTVNSSAEKVEKEIAVKVNGSAEKMKEIALTVNSSAEKVKKEIAVKVNGSAEKGKKEIAVEVNGSAEKMKKETTLAVSKSVDNETVSWPLVMNETLDIFHADPAIVDSKPSIDRTVKGNKTSAANVELKRKDDSMNNENQKSSRKAFNPANQDHTENGPQISPPLPSYMAATESAKAKLRLQGSPRSGQDGDDKNNLTRRQSLPFSANGKSSSQSPRGQRLVHAGKEGSKSERALSSRDRNAKATQVEWRR